MPQPVGRAAIGVTGKAHQVAVELDVSGLKTRLENEAVRLINDFSQQGLRGEALVDAVREGLNALSEAPVDKAARGATSEAFNLGRNLEAQRHVGEIKMVVRSEVLDENTCSSADNLPGDNSPRCFELDGAEYEINTDEYFKHMPPNDCHGFELCRGFYLYKVTA
jgi:hypothetical protein